MAGKRLSIKQKREQRQRDVASQATSTGGDRFDKLISAVNKRLKGGGSIFRGTAIERQEYVRRSTGIPSVDYVLSGGPPKGGLIEIGGEYSSGKTTLALHMCAVEQQVQWALPPEQRRGIAWIALEPFSKRWARQNGFFLPFNEDTYVDHNTGEEKVYDAYAEASELELLRMQQMGIEDPYAEICPFVLVHEDRGDVALDAALDLIKSNLFSYVVVDSLGVAKSTKWLEEAEVQDSGDFDRTAKMIGDYTARACLALNKRYDANNQMADDGAFFNETTCIHLNHIVTNIGTMAMAPWKKYSIKGGEGNKHNHHAILFLYKGEQMMMERPGGSRYVYGQANKIICIKSKIGAPFKAGEFDFYFQPFGQFQAGDIDTAKDAVQLGLILGVFNRRGSHIDFGPNEHTSEEYTANGQDNFADLVRATPELFEALKLAVAAATKRL